MLVLTQTEIKKDLETIRQLLHAGLPGRDLLETVVDFVAWQISLCFVVRNQEKLERYVRGEVVNLLWGIAVGTISDPSITYLLRRYARLCANLLAQKVIKDNQNIYFSQIFHEDHQHEEDFMESFLRRHHLDPIFWVEDPLNDRGGFKRRTLAREKLLVQVPKFVPGCLRESRRECFSQKYPRKEPSHKELSRKEWRKKLIEEYRAQIRERRKKSGPLIIKCPPAGFPKEEPVQGRLF